MACNRQRIHAQFYSGLFSHVIDSFTLHSMSPSTKDDSESITLRNGLIVTSCNFIQFKILNHYSYTVKPDFFLHVFQMSLKYEISF